MIRTDEFSERLRHQAVRLDSRELLIARLEGSDQESDLTVPPNCGGAGRIRHFHRRTRDGWPDNPLPIDPACAFLGLPGGADRIEAQVFQNAACNWRCWYCFVPFALLSADDKRGEWLTAEALVARYLGEADPPAVIDLTGGQPDLVPEWVPWMIGAVTSAGIASSVYLWSDDNLSNDYFFRHLSPREQRQVAEFPGYGRVCCFKGFDSASFSFNTKAHPDLFDRQFDLFGRLLETGMDLYAYATFTAPETDGVETAMSRFVDRLQGIAEGLPLRVVPLEIEEYGPVVFRMKDAHHTAMGVQHTAIDAWNSELERRFTSDERRVPIHQVTIARRG
jgi:uncharacterized Fe-S cluster-containing radical SAM superfamily protein